MIAPHRLAWIVAAGWTLVIPGVARPQEAPPAEAPPELIAEETPTATQALGRFRIGPVYINPLLRIGAISYDSNLYYSPDKPVSDITASVSPGIEAILPVRGALRLRGSGTLHYAYFLDHPELRRLSGGGQGAVEWNGDRAQGVASYEYDRQLQRPDFEVDQRVMTTTETIRGHLLRHIFGRTSIALGGGRARTEYAGGQDFAGGNIRTTLSRTETSGLIGLDYALTIKTSFVVDAEGRRDRFLERKGQDLDTVRIVAGLRTDATALISGELVGGVRWLRPLDPTARRGQMWVGRLEARLNASPKTRVAAHALRDATYSAFGTVPGAAVIVQEMLGLSLDKDLIYGFNLQAFARQTQYRNANLAQAPEAGPVHDNRTREAGADLGFKLRSRLRLGFEARRIQRTSSLDVYQMDDWVFGFTASFQP